MENPAAARADKKSKPPPMDTHRRTDTETETRTAALTDMKPATVAVLLLCYLLVNLIQSAPVSSPSNPSAALTAAAERAKTLVEKILKDVPTVHAATVTTEGLTLDGAAQTANLQMMVTSLGIPAAPVLKPPSERFTLDDCVSHMAAGVRLHQGLLGVLSERLSGLSDLRADLRDLLTHITKMKEAAQLGSGSEAGQSPDLASRLHGNYEVQVATHLTLTQLRSFCHDLIRSLRAVATYRPRPAGAL
ncbi:granulocyte colony-stimulating factor-like [Plectropomus leopardus]|uniref:granulocyte colony-stimulating factor-like n=1 Tax=Plectropomus leopardus TaxID=160734 RepID=UPI001C4C4E2C|nr:granulocyte colony-stimulating factor-like [Plectropomus leopardus]